jgi:hypothetical protein
MRHRRTPSVAVLLSLLLVSACEEGPTQVLLGIRIRGGTALDQVRVSAESSSKRSFAEVLRPEPASELPLEDPQSVLLLLPDEVAGQSLDITAKGLWRGTERARSSTTTVPASRKTVNAEVSLGSTTDASGESPTRDGRREARADWPRTETCGDADGDKYTSCAGDCDDLDASAHPGQTSYFTVASKGKKTWDYSCDGTDEKEVPDLENCVRSGSVCTGHGWQGSIAACGASGTYVLCKTSGSSGCSHETSQRTQGCR